MGAEDCLFCGTPIPDHLLIQLGGEAQVRKRRSEYWWFEPDILSVVMWAGFGLIEVIMGTARALGLRRRGRR